MGITRRNLLKGIVGGTAVALMPKGPVWAQREPLHKHAITIIDDMDGPCGRSDLDLSAAPWYFVSYDEHENVIAKSSHFDLTCTQEMLEYHSKDFSRQSYQAGPIEWSGHVTFREWIRWSPHIDELMLYRRGQDEPVARFLAGPAHLQVCADGVVTVTVDVRATTAPTWR